MTSDSRSAPRRVKLVAATKELLLSSGINAPSTKRVAELAGVSVGTIYNHFIDIDDLIAVAIADWLDGEARESGERLRAEASRWRVRVLEHLDREQDLRARRRT